MVSRRYFLNVLVSLFVVGWMLTSGHGAANAAEPTEVLVVDKVVANPSKFAGVVSVSGTVAKVVAHGLFALGCEDACVAMPVRFAGPMPTVGSEVVVRGQVTKDASGRFVFNAESVTEKK